MGVWDGAMRESAGEMGEIGDRGWESGREQCGREGERWGRWGIVGCEYGREQCGRDGEKGVVG